jgi:hypothetical protein
MRGEPRVAHQRRRPAAVSSQPASSSADAVIRSTRIRSVSSPFSTTHAVNGLIVGPVCCSSGFSSTRCTRRGPSTAPPSVRPCPSMCFVVEYTTTSAPRSSGRCSTGVAKMLSTMTRAPAACASSLTAATSTSSCIGFDGVSKNTTFAGVASAASHCARSWPSTRSVVTPQRGRIDVRIWKHEPNSAREATTRSPARSIDASALNTADMPLAVVRAASAPSSSAAAPRGRRASGSRAACSGGGRSRR